MSTNRNSFSNSNNCFNKESLQYKVTSASKAEPIFPDMRCFSSSGFTSFLISTKFWKYSLSKVTVYKLLEFIERCRKYAQEQVNLQRDGFIRLGIIADWKKPYLTMNFKYEADVVRALGKIIKNGHLVHGRKPVHWCTSCASALAEAEVEYKDKESFAIDVKFRISDNKQLNSKLGIELKNLNSAFIPIWTTTPWTLPANQAVAINPKFVYSIVEAYDECFIIAKDLLNEVLTKYKIDNYSIRTELEGKSLEGLILNHPFLDKKVPVILGDHVTSDAGTGAVHTAPGHGQEDYAVGIKNNLPIENPVDSHGCFFDNVPIFAKEFAFKANEHVIDVLKQNNNLINVDIISHSYPHCWRHKTPLIFRATNQWFISMDKNGLRKKALFAIENVEWLPTWGKNRIKSMIEQRPDWCISRQRTWGTPLPLFLHKETGKIHPKTEELIEKIANLIEKQGIVGWTKLDKENLLSKEDAKNYEKIQDTLDVWFDSGVTHACVLNARDDLSFPTDLYLEGSDQHRGWFQSSLITSLAMYGDAPFKTVLTHGHVLDKNGYKMSKSQGNVISPEKIANSMGADILRLWVASVDYASDINCSDESLKHTSDAYRRLRNTVRFFLSNLYDFDFEKNAIAFSKMIALDRWAVNHAKSLQIELKAAYEKYQFSVIYQKLHNFCNVSMGSFYLDIIKDRLYTCKKNSHARRSSQTALYHILQAFVCWIAPVLSFTAEEIWQCMHKSNDSVFLSGWYDDIEQFVNGNTFDKEYWQNLVEIRNEVNKELEKHRISGKIGSALEAEVTLYCNDSLLKQLLLLENELRFVLITSAAKAVSDKELKDDAVKTNIDGLQISVKALTYKKCIRCWHRREDVGKNEKYPDICSRCVENIDNSGENRLYA